MPRAISLDDFLKLKIVSDPQFAPDGARIACVVRVTDAEKNRYRGEIWATPAQEGEPRRMTSPESGSSGPRWSPDGAKIAFVSDRQKPKSQIYLLPSDGGEAVALTNLEIEGSIQGLCWSPDGAKIAFLFRATPEAWRKETVEERKKQERSSPVRVHTRLFYRLDGLGYFDGEYAQVWAADVATGECRQLTSGPYACRLPVWAPDGETLAFLSDRRDDADILGPYPEIWTVPASGGDLTRIPSPPGSKSELSLSPDGSRFAYIGDTDMNDSWGANNSRVMVLSATGGDRALDLTGRFDLSVGYDTLSDSHDAGAGDALQWSPDGDALFFPGSRTGDTRLYRVAADGGGEPVPLTGPHGEMGGFSLSADGARIAYTRGTATTPHELFVTAVGDDLAPAQRTCFNREWLEEVRLAIPEPIEAPNNEGGLASGWLLNPPERKPSERCPLVLYVHGGPHTQYGSILFHELQLLAAQGYVVLYINPRGSKGYGEAHTKAIAGDWGGPDFRDLMAAVDYAVELSHIDARRTAIMGGSYGGFMTAWAIGHTDRFRCAIADRLVGNLHSMAGTCDFPWRHGSYFKGDSWNDPSDLWRCSPLAFAGRITTPLLLIHSDGDLRCPAGQAEELFAALRLQRKIVEYVRYPAESSHGLSRNGPPDLRLDRLQRNLAWLARWLKA